MLYLLEHNQIHFCWETVFMQKEYFSYCIWEHEILLPKWSYIFSHSVYQNALIYSAMTKHDTFLISFQFSWCLGSSIPRLVLRIGPHFAAPRWKQKKTADKQVAGLFPWSIFQMWQTWGWEQVTCEDSMGLSSFF